MECAENGEMLSNGKRLVQLAEYAETRDVFMTKPYNLEDFVATVQRMLALPAVVNEGSPC